MLSERSARAGRATACSQYVSRLSAADPTTPASQRPRSATGAATRAIKRGHAVSDRAFLLANAHGP